MRLFYAVFSLDQFLGKLFLQGSSRSIIEVTLCLRTVRYFQGRPHVFYEIGGLKNFTKLTGKYLCQGTFLARLRP